MKNPFNYSDDNKRYHTFNYYLKNRYGAKVAKVTLDAFFTCPNRDGTLSNQGCIFCSPRGSGDYTFQDKNLLTQYQNNYQVMARKWPNCKSIAYFQAYTNTYGPLDKIQSMIQPFMQLEECVAISIATRPDCLEDEKIAYLQSLTAKKDIWVELGLQSSNDITAKLINRGHDFNCLKLCLDKLKTTDIKVCLHIINGLPNEDEEKMIQTIIDIQNLPFDALKIHMLHVIDNTPLARSYKAKPFEILTKEQYIDIVIKQLELLPPHIVIQRMTGDPVKEDLIEPKWLINKTQLLNDIDKKMVEYDSYQGKKYAQR